jgi:putative peptide zinc metalloprotease protein
MTLSTTHPTSPPELAHGVELLGPYQGSGFREPRYLARRPDGQIVQLPALLYRVTEGAAEGQDYATIAERVGDEINRSVSAGDVQFVVDEKLRPLGLLGNDDERPAQATPPSNPLLALKYKSALVPPTVVRIVATTFMPLFYPPVVLAVLAAAGVLDVWLFGIHGLAQGLRSALYEPTTLLLILGLLFLSAVFHECGHAAATRYGGARPGAMGAGLYIVWPALYTDITDSYRLGKAGRLRADLGGVYFNTIFMLLTAAAYFLTGFEPLLLMIPLQHLEIVHQLLPFLRLDGYYIVSDLTGVPDILSRIKPTLKSLVPGIETDPRVRELKPWARAVVTLYLLLLVPIVLLLFTMMALAAPRIFATAWDAFGVTWQHGRVAIDRREAVASLVSVIQLAVLALSPLGLALTFASAARRVTRAVWRGTETRPRARAVLVVAGSATLTAVFLNWWTNGDYRPVAAAERGTVSGDDLDVRAALGYPRHNSHSPHADTTPKREYVSRPSRSSGIKPRRSDTHTQTPTSPVRRGGTTTRPAARTTTTAGSFAGTTDTTAWPPETTTQDTWTTPTVTEPEPTVTTTTTTTTPTTTSGP